MKIKYLFLFVFTASMFMTSCGDDCTVGDTWYEDQDGDGLGNPLSTKVSCEQPAGFVDNNTDDFDLVVNNDQRAVMSYFGATWCPPCGAFGGPLIDYMDASISRDDVVVLSFQTNDAISPAGSTASNFADQISALTDVPFLPNLQISGGTYYQERGLFNDDTANQNRINNDIGQIDGQQTTVGVSGVAKMEDNQVKVNVGLEFYSASSENYFVNTFLIENDVIADQQTISSGSTVLAPDVSHDFVVRTAADGSSSFRGKNLGSSFAAGDVVGDDFTVTIPAGVNTDNIKIAVVVYRGSGYNMENGVQLDIN